MGVTLKAEHILRVFLRLGRTFFHSFRNERRFSQRTQDLFPLDSIILYTDPFRASPTIMLLPLRLLVSLKKTPSSPTSY